MRMKRWFDRFTVGFMVAYGVTMFPYSLLFWDETAMQAIAWINLAECLILLYVFPRLFFLTKKGHRYEFNRQKKQLVVYFSITMFQCFAKFFFMLMGSENK